MAKTFKKPAAASVEQSKPISERDFFDLTDEPLSQVAATQVADGNNSGNISNKAGKNKVIATGNSLVTNSQATPVPTADLEERDVRQTFVVSSLQLEQLRDFVHARKVQGDYEYSQKQALQEALTLLFASAPSVAPRPTQTRESEQRRRERIKKGRVK